MPRGLDLKLLHWPKERIVGIVEACKSYERNEEKGDRERNVTQKSRLKGTKKNHIIKLSLK